MLIGVDDLAQEEHIAGLNNRDGQGPETFETIGSPFAEQQAILKEFGLDTSGNVEEMCSWLVETRANYQRGSCSRCWTKKPAWAMRLRLTSERHDHVAHRRHQRTMWYQYLDWITDVQQAQQ